jgi:26S proteasome regulatory subunit T6
MVKSLKDELQLLL